MAWRKSCVRPSQTITISAIGKDHRIRCATTSTAARPEPAESARAQAVVGSLLVLGGALLLADNLGWLRWPDWADVGTLWPLALVGLGIGLIVKSQRRTAHSRSGDEQPQGSA